MDIKIHDTLFCRETEVTVLARGHRPENLSFLVHEVFERLIEESFRGIEYDYKVPCPECMQMVGVHVCCIN